MTRDFRFARTVLSAFAAAFTMFAAMPVHAADAVVLYTADGLENLYKDVLPAFEKKEGVKVNIVTAGSGEVVNRATVEKDSPKADVIVTLPPFIQQARQSGLLQPYQSVNYKNVPAIAKAPNGAWATFVNNYFSFAINPEVTKTAPKTFADLLHPDYSGKIAYSNPATAGDGMAVIILTLVADGRGQGVRLPEEARARARSSTPRARVTSTCCSRATKSRSRTATCRWIWTTRPTAACRSSRSSSRPSPATQPTTFQLPYAIGLIKNGPNQAAGKKLIDYLMSTEVQAKVPDIYGIPGRTDVPLAGKNGEAVKQAIAGVKLIPVDWNHVMDEEGRLDRALEERSDRQSSGKQIEVVKPKS